VVVRAAFLLLALALAPVLCCAEGVRIALRSHVEVQGAIATLGDVAQLEGDEQLVARVSTLTLVELTDLAQHRISAAQVRTAVLAVAPGRIQSLTGECLVSRRALVVSAAELVSAAIAAASADTASETQATRLRDGGALTVPDDAQGIRLVADALDNRVSGEIPYRVRVMRGEVELGRTLVTLSVVRYRSVAVAAHVIHQGDVIAAADVRSMRVAVDAVSRYAPGEADGLVGQSARGDIAEGTPLVGGLLKPHLDVHGGASVSLVYVSTGIEVTASGEALGDGKVGDVISVRRSIDGQLVKGRISAPGEVRVNY
jgi:flagella basal body P-ring formation protein FlgA